MREGPVGLAQDSPPRTALEWVDVAEGSDTHWVVEECKVRPKVVVLLETDNLDLMEHLNYWSKAQQHIDVVFTCCRHHNPNFSSVTCREESQGDACWLSSAVRYSHQLLKKHGGKLVVVWDHRHEIPNSGLEALVTVAQSVMVEVVSVGYTMGLWHPVLITALAKGGGTLRKVKTKKDVIEFLNHPNFWPWGVMATVRVAAPPGVHVTRACGHGAAWDGKCITVPCLAGRPLLGLEL